MTQHQDVIRIVSSSSKSFDDAVAVGIKELLEGPHHKDLRFSKFTVVLLSGIVSPDGEILFEATLDVVGDHPPETPT
jgi:hypothetical protein